MGKNRSNERPYFSYGNEWNYVYVLDVSQYVILAVSNTLIKFTSHGKPRAIQFTWDRNKNWI